MKTTSEASHTEMDETARKSRKISVENGAWRRAATEAIWNGDLATLGALRPIVKANSMVQKTPYTSDPQIALIVAVEAKNSSAMNWLLKKSTSQIGVNVSEIVELSENRRTPLIIAAQAGNLEAVQALIPFSDVDATSTRGDTALTIAAAGGEDEVVIELAQVSDVKKRTAQGATALMQAASNLRPQALLALLPLSDALAQNDDGDTALMWAAYWGRADNVAILLPHSDPWHRNKEGSTAFDDAAGSLEEKKWAVVDLLADTVPRERVEAIFAKAGAEKMPRWAARREAEELEKTVREEKNSASGSPAQGGAEKTTRAKRV